jgi:hypothetical protein
LFRDDFYLTTSITQRRYGELQNKRPWPKTWDTPNRSDRATSREQLSSCQRTFVRLNRFQRSITLLATNSIYLSDTKGFNDPWDCRPCFDLTRLDDPTFYQRQVEYFRTCRLENAIHTCPKTSIANTCRVRSPDGTDFTFLKITSSSLPAVHGRNLVTPMSECFHPQHRG